MPERLTLVQNQQVETPRVNDGGSHRGVTVFDGIKLFTAAGLVASTTACAPVDTARKAIWGGNETTSTQTAVPPAQDTDCPPREAYNNLANECETDLFHQGSQGNDGNKTTAKGCPPGLEKNTLNGDCQTPLFGLKRLPGFTRTNGRWTVSQAA